MGFSETDLQRASGHRSVAIPRGCVLRRANVFEDALIIPTGPGGAGDTGDRVRQPAFSVKTAVFALGLVP